MLRIKVADKGCGYKSWIKVADKTQEGQHGLS